MDHITVGSYVVVTATGDAGRVVGMTEDSGVGFYGVRLDSGRTAWLPEGEIEIDARYAQPEAAS